ncbi:MAG: Cytochrome c, class I [Cytophagales bacterium]|jgi:mono/diheme cytochrome c family protein|nr:MAG: Cytochrome c, class I [Cytophagales bacterium]
MSMKKTSLIVVAAATIIFACSPGKPQVAQEDTSIPQAETVPAPAANQQDPRKGLGEVKHVTLKTPLEQDRVRRGEEIYEMKCGACHKLTDERLVGPGWKGVTQRRHPEWIMNMVTNVDVMLDQDAEAQKLLELCLTRMPNQNVSIGDARDVLEFMRSNDGQK